MSASILAADTDQWARSVTDNFISLSVHSTETRFQGCWMSPDWGTG